MEDSEARVVTAVILWGLLSGACSLAPECVGSSCPGRLGAQEERAVARGPSGARLSPPTDAPGAVERRKEAPSPKPEAAKKSEVPTKPAKVPTLDLAALEKRLRETKAIGILTKLSLKNQVDDLLEQFRTFHRGQGGATLAQLRERYDLLLLKVLSLLQDTDPALARDISGSREALWGLLADPAKFATL